MTAVLEFSQVVVQRGGFRIVDTVSGRLEAGQILALLGPNGAGKTTLLRAALGIEPISSGQVFIQGQLDLSPRDRARAVAYVPQHGRLSAGLSAREVVELGRFPHRGERFGLSRYDAQVVSEAMLRCDCAYLDRRPFRACSGGEQARLLIARALATEAPALLLDEPAASLDIGHRLQLYHLLRLLADQGKAIMMAMHHLEDVLSLSDSAMLMNCGQVVVAGPPAEVLQPQYLAKVYGVAMIPGAGMGWRLQSETPGGG
ncbi:MAG: ABC transporter ATP-binding protein [Planctomycetota bacterium]|nr:MAG: ABC transporter ATP-binding protein [Planctomycetota bacterium]